MIQILLMEKPQIESSPEIKKYTEIIRAVDSDLMPIICYYAINKPHFPMEATAVCRLMQSQINDRYNFKLTLCEGTRTDTNTGNMHNNHVWLESDDLIIDPTDFQFQAIAYDLAPTDENIVPTGVDLSKLSKQALNDLLMATYIDNCYKKFLENPNDKEKRFKELVDLLKDRRISQEEFLNELRDNYGGKTYYYKSDKESGIVYAKQDTQEEPKQ